MSRPRAPMTGSLLFVEPLIKFKWHNIYSSKGEHIFYYLLSWWWLLQECALHFFVPFLHLGDIVCIWVLSWVFNSLRHTLEAFVILLNCSSYCSWCLHAYIFPILLENFLWFCLDVCKFHFYFLLHLLGLDFTPLWKTIAWGVLDCWVFVLFCWWWSDEACLLCCGVWAVPLWERTLVGSGSGLTCFGYDCMED